MIRLAHVSDIHITTLPLEWTRADFFNKRLAAWLNFRWLGRAWRFQHANEVLERLMVEVQERSIDHMLFSGDATALGFSGEMQRAAQLLKVDTFPGLAVPGNHDYCTIPAERSGEFEAIFAPWLKGRRLEDATYPFAQRVGPVWLIGVCSATGNRMAWDATGAAGPIQRQRLAALLQSLDPGPRILVTHYPLCLANGQKERPSHGLRDLRELVEVAAKGGVSLWVHGHRHGFYFFQRSQFAPFPVVCAGSATQTHLWNYCEYAVDDSKVEVLRRVYNPDKKTFEDAERVELRLLTDYQPAGG